MVSVGKSKTELGTINLQYRIPNEKHLQISEKGFHSYESTSNVQNESLSFENQSLNPFLGRNKGNMMCPTNGARSVELELKVMYTHIP